MTNRASDAPLLEGFIEQRLRISLGTNLETQYLLTTCLIVAPSLGLLAGFAALDDSGAFGRLMTG